MTATAQVSDVSGISHDADSVSPRRIKRCQPPGGVSSVRRNRSGVFMAIPFQLCIELFDCEMASGGNGAGRNRQELSDGFVAHFRELAQQQNAPQFLGQSIDGST
jgi:hypothetical protein